MKVKVFKVRIWKFICRKRISTGSFIARLFRRKSSRAQVLTNGRDQLHASLVRGSTYSDGEFEEAGPAITKQRMASAISLAVKSEEQALERKVHSTRHMQVITMWNPGSVTTVEAPVESSAKTWLEHASKKWKDHGSARMLLDPIENVPETSQDWRSRVFDIDPDSKWLVQGW